MSVRHLYVHVPFCAPRCGYCDFVTVTGHEDAARPLRRCAARRAAPARRRSRRSRRSTSAAARPRCSADGLLARAAGRRCRPARRASPSSATPRRSPPRSGAGAAARRRHPDLAGRAELPAAPARDARAAGAAGHGARRAVATLRAAGHREPQPRPDVRGSGPVGAPTCEADIDAVLALRPEHISWYELEAKPGTRFAVHHGAELARVRPRRSRTTTSGRRRAARPPATAGTRRPTSAGPGRECRHNLGYWLGHDYLGVGVGAVSTLGLRAARATAPACAAISRRARRARAPPHDVELLTAAERGLERLMLGLRLDRPLRLDGLAALLDEAACARLRGGRARASATARRSRSPTAGASWPTTSSRACCDERAARRSRRASS